MKYLIDTNICIHFFRGRFEIAEKLEQVGPENCAISEITYLLIGTTAVENNLIMVTENVCELRRIEGIEIENWIVRN